MDVLIWAINHMQELQCYPQGFLSAAQKRPHTSVCGCQPAAPQERFVATVTQCTALCTAKSVWMRCSHALASVTFRNTSVLTYIPQPKNILSFCITSRLSGWKNYELKGDYQSCLLKERKCWEGQHGSRAAFKTSSLGVYYRPPTATHTYTHSNHQPSCFTPLQWALKHAEPPAVFAANQQPIWSWLEIANILEMWFKYHSSFSASVICH